MASLLLLILTLHFPQPALAADAPWWHQYPSFAALDTAEQFSRTKARIAMHGHAIDPTWGPYGQRLAELDSERNYRGLKDAGARVIVWIEGVGDCMTYALEVERKPDGSFVRREDDPTLALGRRSHWAWWDPALVRGNTFRWVGIHNIVNDEDFTASAFTREALGLPAPEYPDGRPAIGFDPSKPYPINALVYDACGSKDINGNLYPSCEATSHVNELLPDGTRRGPTEGLFPAILGKDDVGQQEGLKAGDPVYCGVISVHKDLSAPFWREYVRLSARETARRGVDGVWCDNFSAWDNFGHPPTQKAFGEWSVALFHAWLRLTLPPRERKRLGIADPGTFDVRQYLKAKATEFGAKDPSAHQDPAWRDARWLDDPVWGAYRAFRQQQAQRDLKAFYEALHQGATEGGKPDFLLAGNDIPWFGLGWVRGEWLDMVNTEVSPGWHPGTGSRGMLLPPQGKMAVTYRVSLEHQSSPFSAAWYYLDGDNAKYQDNPELSKLLCAEAFANGAVLLCDENNKKVSGTPETHAWWNQFIRDHEADFGSRVPRADVGVLFSPDNQLAQMTPGGYLDMDRQPHIFGHWGFATALIDAHIPYRAITDWQLDAAHLAGLKTLILPDADCLETPVAKVLTTWVRSGGRLILTGETGTRFGPSGYFLKRPKPLLGGLVGQVTRPVETDATRGSALQGATVVRGSYIPVATAVRRLAKGSILSAPAALGMDYYLNAATRDQTLPGLAELVGPSAQVDASTLPTTVGLFTWQSPDGSAIFADLVNYDISLDADSISPASDLTFRLRLPKDWTGAQATTITPDDSPVARVIARKGWATVRLQRLGHYASVKLTPLAG